MPPIGRTQFWLPSFPRRIRKISCKFLRSANCNFKSFSRDAMFTTNICSPGSERSIHASMRGDVPDWPPGQLISTGSVLFLRFNESSAEQLGKQKSRSTFRIQPSWMGVVRFKNQSVCGEPSSSLRTKVTLRISRLNLELL
jgi:hypothetical protein